MPSIEHRTDDLIARHRENRSRATRQEIEDLYTDGCAELLDVEARHLRAKRRLRADAMDAAPDDAPAAQRIAALAAEREELEQRTTELRNWLRHLRTVVEWHAGEQRRSA